MTRNVNAEGKDIPSWVRESVVIQPWSDDGDEDRFIKYPAQHISILKRYAINTVVFIPTEAHNHMSALRIAQAPDNLRRMEDRVKTKTDRIYTDEQFRNALTAYRKAGIRVLLYSCLAHVGHHPVWHRLVKEHPDWLTRDQKRNPYFAHGDFWFCPNNEEAFQYVAGYTRRLVREYRPDGILMDNNFFPVLCYCPACERKFRLFCKSEFGQPRAIPRKRNTVLYEMWIAWRYRVVRQWTARLKRMLKTIQPDLVLVTNSFFKANNWFSADTEQCDIVDVNLTECYCTPSAIGISARMAESLGRRRKHAMLFLCTWKGKEGDGSMTMAPAPQVKSVLAATIGHLASPWLVNYGALAADETTSSARAVKSYLQFRRRYAEYYRNAQTYTRLALGVSCETLDHDHDPLTKGFSRRWLDANLSCFIDRHIPFDVVHTTTLSAEICRKYAMILFPRPACLSEGNLKDIVAYVKQGGLAVITENPGTCDEWGWKRKQPALQRFFKEDLTARSKSAYERKIGRGLLVYMPVDRCASYAATFRNAGYLDPLLTLIARTGALVLKAENCPSAVEINPTVQLLGRRQRFVVHIINNEGGGSFFNIGITLVAPRTFQTRIVRWLSPDGKQALSLKFKQVGTEVQWILPRFESYALVVIESNQ